MDWGDHRLAAAFGQPEPKLTRVVGAVGEQAPGRGRVPQQLGRADQVVSVARGDDQRPGAAALVGQGVDLRGPAAARGPDRLGEGPPFAPAAERCALT